ncbi:hypothetical protein ENBRE01_0131 [Enteropsectra breve]|nr:hypothetical protein ENBRE01_0131 [Enteropsectra breve]
MKICYALARCLAVSFETKKFFNPYAKNHLSTLHDEETEPDIFFLSEVFSLEMLRDKITIKSSPDSDKIFDHFNKNPCKTSSHSMDSLGSSDSLIHLYYTFVESYNQALNKIPYALLEDPACFTGKLVHYLNKNSSELLWALSSLNEPLLTLNLEFDPCMMKRVFLMRHHLFHIDHTEVNPKMLVEMLSYYEKANFAKEHVADIFIRDSFNRDLHYKIKCDIVFGINVYFLLAKHKLLKDFKDVLFGVTEKSVNCYQIFKHSSCFSMYGLDSSVFKRLSFLKPLFRIVDVNVNPCSNLYVINFSGVLKNMSFVELPDGKMTLQINPEGRYSTPIHFLHLFNEENHTAKNIARLEAIAPEEISSDLTSVICALIELLPQIKELSLINSAGSKHHHFLPDHSISFDKFLYNLLLNHKQTLEGLTGLEVLGFNKLSKDTTKLLKQHSFEKFGLRGILLGADPVYVFRVFEPEPLSNGLNEFNKLKRSVTHFVGINETVRLAAEYGLVPNMKDASIHLQEYNTKHPLCLEEQCVFAELEDFKQNNKNAVPLPLDTLEIIPESFPKNYTVPASRGSARKGSPVPVVESQNIAFCHSPCRLVLLNSVSYARDLKSMEKISSFAASEDILEISLTTDDISDREYFLQNLAALNFTGKFLVLNMAADTFIIPENTKGLYKIGEATLKTICRIYKEYINGKEKRLKLRFNFRRGCSINKAYLERLVLSYILKTSSLPENCAEEKEAIGNKISIEIACKYKQCQKVSTQRCAHFAIGESY